MPLEPFPQFESDEPPNAGASPIFCGTNALAYPLHSATYLPTARISAGFFQDAIAARTWNAAPIARFAQQRRAEDYDTDCIADRATEPADWNAIVRDWQSQPLDPAIEDAIWQLVRRFPSPAIAIVPHLSSAVLRDDQSDDQCDQCAAIAEMMHRPIVWRRFDALMAGIKATWSELFRPRLVRVWAAAGLSNTTLRLSLELRALPHAYASGVAELHGDRLHVVATWGMASILDSGLVIPDRVTIDLPSAAIVAQHLGQKPCYQMLGAPDRPSPEQLVPVPPNQQAQFALPPDRLKQLVALMRSLQCWQHPALGCGVRVRWSLGRLHPEAIEAEAIAPNPQHELFVHAIEPLTASAKPTVGDPCKLQAQSTDLTELTHTATWRGSGASSGQATATALVFSPDSTDNRPPPPGAIWVCSSVPETQLQALRQAAGLVVEAGSHTSHPILLARDLGLPIVVGVTGILGAIVTGDRLHIDADLGQVKRDVKRDAAASGTHRDGTSSLPAIPPIANDDRTSKLAASIALTASQRPSPAGTTGTTTDTARRTHLRVALSYLDRAMNLKPASDGIGLLRSEMLAFADGQTLVPDPTPQQYTTLHHWLHQRLHQAITLCGDRSLFYRVFDRLTPSAALSDRGLGLYQQQPVLLDLQLQAIAELHRSGHTQLRLLLPFVRSPAELTFCWQRLERLGIDRDRLPVWIMAEVPSALVFLEEYCQMGIAGITIGTNDLAVFLLGLDRESEPRPDLNQATRRALNPAIVMIAQIAARHNLACQLCDDTIVDDPDMLAHFLRSGVTALAVSADRLHQAQQAIAIAEQIQSAPTHRSQPRP